MCKTTEMLKRVVQNLPTKQTPGSPGSLASPTKHKEKRIPIFIKYSQVYGERATKTVNSPAGLAGGMERPPAD